MSKDMLDISCLGGLSHVRETKVNMLLKYPMMRMLSIAIGS
jgi:hypothetical protein